MSLSTWLHAHRPKPTAMSDVDLEMERRRNIVSGAVLQLVDSRFSPEVYGSIRQMAMKGDLSEETIKMLYKIVNNPGVEMEGYLTIHYVEMQEMHDRSSRILDLAVHADSARVVHHHIIAS